LAKSPPEEPDALVAHVRVCEGPGRRRPGLLDKSRTKNSVLIRRKMSGWVLLAPLWLMILSLILFAASGYGATNYYVWRNNPSPGTPFTNWIMAATSIQDVVDLTLAGDRVYVTNGIYDTGGKVTPGYVLTNRVCVTAAITLISTNGPAVTIIKGAEAPGGGNGDGAVRCVYLTNGASLIGFTLTNGHTMLTGDFFDNVGGGVFLRASYGKIGAVVSNCLISGNMAGTGGGVYIYFAGIVNNCILSGNTSETDGGGISFNGGGVANNCILSGNRATNNVGGGVSVLAGTMNNCLLSKNTSFRSGGGAYFNGANVVGSLSNCTIVSNISLSTITGDLGGGGGGVGFKSNSAAVMNNCIVWGNRAAIDPQNIKTNLNTALGVIRYTCSSPKPDGDGNIGLARISHKASQPLAARPCE